MTKKEQTKQTNKPMFVCVDDVIAEAKKRSLDLHNNDECMYIIKIAIEMVNMAYTRGYEDGRKEVE